MEENIRGEGRRSELSRRYLLRERDKKLKEGTRRQKKRKEKKPRNERR